MPDVSRLRTTFTGLRGGPGVATMYFLDTLTAVASVHAFWENFSGEIPMPCTIQVESQGDTLDVETGHLTGTWVADPVAPIHCTAGDGYPGGVGAVIDWLTDTIGPHRRLRGRTFVVPLYAAAFDTDGSLMEVKRAAYQAYGTGLIFDQSTSFVIWHRGSGSSGSTGLVTHCVVPDIAAHLTSRRG